MKKKSLFFLLLCCLMLCFAHAETPLTETVLFSGEQAASGGWTLALSLNTTNADGTFDPSLMTEGGYFAVTYDGAQNGVYLALSDWQGGAWAQMNVPSACTMADDGHYTAVFSFEQCRMAYGSMDFSAIDQICVGTSASTKPAVIYSVAWYGQAAEDLLGADEVLFSGAVTSTAQNECLVYRFTQHVGGTFDASQMRTDSRLYVEYSGAKYGVYLALSSHSGATQWTRVNASETVEVASGRYGAYYDEASMAAAFGTNFARLDQISVYSSGNQPVTLHRLAYFAGTGEQVDTSDGRWDCPDMGIAFIGDSICQNAKLLYGDWNAILGRGDCVNYGIGGQTTLECRARIDEVASHAYRQVVFICGINDIGRGYTKEEIVQSDAAMIAAIQAKQPDCQFVLLSVLPTTSAFYSGQQGKITLLNLALKRYANQTPNVTFVDAYSAFCPRAGEYADPTLLSDGLHPNESGYAKIAEILAPYLLPETEMPAM